MSTKEENKLTQAVLVHGPDILKYSVNDLSTVSKYIDRVFSENLNYPIPVNQIDPNNWFIPNSYKNLDINKYLLDQCPNENKDRLILELDLFEKNKMIPVLQTMKYIVDTLRKNGIVWGVGRGSSVASYALYLIGVHKIDSVKYNLPIEEFFKGEQNG